MANWLRYFWKVSTLKQGPGDAPFSKSALYLSTLACWFIGMLVLLNGQPLFLASLLSAIQVGILIFLTQIALWIAKTPERLAQTITAMMGAGTVIAIAALPVVLMLRQSEDFLAIAANGSWLLLIAWEALVIAHVLKHALDTNFIAGLGISLIYMYMSFAITVRLIKVISIVSGT